MIEQITQYRVTCDNCATQVEGAPSTPAGWVQVLVPGVGQKDFCCSTCITAAVGANNFGQA